MVTILNRRLIVTTKPREPGRHRAELLRAVRCFPEVHLTPHPPENAAMEFPGALVYLGAMLAPPKARTERRRALGGRPRFTPGMSRAKP